MLKKKRNGKIDKQTEAAKKIRQETELVRDDGRKRKREKDMLREKSMKDR